MLMFLALNGVELVYTQEELVQIILNIAAGSTTFDELLIWLLDHQT